VARACQTLRGRLATIAAHLLQCAEPDVALRQGRFHGPSGDVSVREVAICWYVHPHLLPQGVHAGGLEVTEGFKPKVDTGQFSYGTHAAVVEIDRELGTLKFLDYVIVEDCGTRVNPMIVEGQTLGGAAQGIGTALLEEMPYDENGQPLATSLADYLLPGTGEIPTIALRHLETPSPHTEFGIKGIGEGGAIPPPAAIFNAVNDALRGLGVEMNETPVTPRRILAAIAAAKTRRNSPDDGVV
jgi:carbon-monoxide dehydrogenase large subunit